MNTHSLTSAARRIAESLTPPGQHLGADTPVNVATGKFPKPTLLLLQAMEALAAQLRARAGGTTQIRAPSSLALEKGAIHAVGQPRGRRVTCVSGALWLTFDNTPHDVVLEAGESLTCVAESRLLIQALQGARLRVD